MNDYNVIFNGFLLRYNDNTVDPISAGEVLMRLTALYADYNNKMAVAERGMNLVAREIEMRTDENTGKPISSAKASVFLDATEEAYNYKIAKMHVLNVEQFINSLKTLAKLISGEYNLYGSK